MFGLSPYQVYPNFTFPSGLEGRKFGNGSKMVQGWSIVMAHRIMRQDSPDNFGVIEM